LFNQFNCYFENTKVQTFSIKSNFFAKIALAKLKILSAYETNIVIYCIDA